MKKKFIIAAMIMLAVAFAGTMTACGDSQISITQIALEFENEGFLVEIEGPVLFAIRLNEDGAESLMLWQFSTRAGAEGAYALMVEALDSNQIAYHYGTRAWYGTAAAVQLADYLIRGVGSRPVFPL